MKRQCARWDAVCWASVIATLVCASVALSAPPWRKLIPFRTVEADPHKSYWLTEDQGPWMILAHSFDGDGAEEKARELVLELRKKFKVEAYMHRREFDYTEPVYGRGLNRFGGPKLMKYRNATKTEQVAVLAGNFASHESPGADEDLEAIKTAKPECLVKSSGTERSQERFLGQRQLQRLVNADPEKQKLGPMWRAFIVRNPLLPKEYFVSQGLDPLVLQMNKYVEHSLLNNPAQFTVRVASFQGESHFVGDDPDDDAGSGGRFSMLPGFKKQNKLEVAADHAHRLTLALRKRGIEAYEFHDRFESIVTVGSFESVGTALPDGRIDLIPAVYQIMQTYGAERISLPQGGQALKPRTLDGIRFDVQPMPVKVPRRSIGSDYAAGNHDLR